MDESAGQVRPSESRRHGGARRVLMDLESVNRFFDVFQVLSAEIFIAEGKPVANLFVNGRGDADVTGPRQRLQPRCNIDAVAAHIVVIDQDLTEIDSDAEPELTLLFEAFVEGFHLSLQFHAETDCIDRTVEKQKQAI